jgi:hypothetical protein
MDDDDLFLVGEGEDGLAPIDLMPDVPFVLEIAGVADEETDSARCECACDCLSPSAPGHMDCARCRLGFHGPA